MGFRAHVSTFGYPDTPQDLIAVLMNIEIKKYNGKEKHVKSDSRAIVVVHWAVGRLRREHADHKR